MYPLILHFSEKSLKRKMKKNTLHNVVFTHMADPESKTCNIK